MKEDREYKLGQLSLEQQFQPQILDREIEHLSFLQAKDYLLEVFRQISVREKKYVS